MTGLWDKVRQIFLKKDKINIRSLKESFDKVKSENTTRDLAIDDILIILNSHSSALKSNSRAIKQLLKLIDDYSKIIEGLFVETMQSGKVIPTSRLNGYLNESSTHSEALPTVNPTSATSPTLEYEQKYADIDSLTHLQQNTLFTIANLMLKENARWIAMKTLVGTVYPGKPYNTVRTTIFEYIKMFEELGLVKRLKRGNLTYVGVTDKALKIIGEKETNRKTKLIKLTNKVT